MKPEPPTILPWLAWMQPEKKPFEYEPLPVRESKQRDRAAQKERRRRRELRRR